MFDDLEVFSLMAACLCHDLDHRGTNNAFQAKLVYTHQCWCSHERTLHVQLTVVQKDARPRGRGENLMLTVKDVYILASSVLLRGWLPPSPCPPSRFLLHCNNVLNVIKENTDFRCRRVLLPYGIVPGSALWRVKMHRYLVSFFKTTP